MKCLVGLFAAFLFSAGARGQMRVVELPSQSPLINFRIVFQAGSAADPADKPGLAYLTAMMLARGGSREKTYQQVLDTLFPMAASVGVQVDKEMCTFSGATHADNLEGYYTLLRDQLLNPGWHSEDLERVRDEAINALRVNLRNNNDEELGKEVLEEEIYRGTPYEKYSMGTVSSLRRISLQDVQGFYRAEYTQANLILGMAGGYAPAFLERVKKDFGGLPRGEAARAREVAPAPIERNRAVIVEKDTRSVDYSIGFPMAVTRARRDYAALLLAASYLGQHRSSGGRLYERMREARGLNYGDYAYIEYFPRGMFQLEPSPNLARRAQMFQIWIRPVEPPTAHFALRLALYEMDRLVREGISEEAFERTRDFLGKYVNVLTRSKSAELGYAIDSLFYGIPNYNQYLKAELSKLTRAQVNAAIRGNWRSDRLVIIAVTRNGEELKSQLAGDAPSPMFYNSAKATDIAEEDQIVEKLPLHLRAADVRVIPADKIFE